MTSTTVEAEILKQDTRGRVRVPAERREALLAEFERSALSGAKFARLAGIKYATFANWVQRRRKQRAAAVAATGSEAMKAPAAGVSGGSVRLFEAIVEGRREAARPAVAEGLVIELPGGSRMAVGSPVQLQMAAELVALVAQRISARC